jgi:hypothetical protein
MSLLAFISSILFFTAAILYYVFITKPIEYEKAKETDARREAEEKLQDIDRLLSDALSEASGGCYQKYTSNL